MKNGCLVMLIVIFALSGCSAKQSVQPQESSFAQATLSISSEASSKPETDVPAIPQDESDLWNKKEWSYMGPNSEIIGTIKEEVIQDRTLIYLKVEVEANLTDTGSISKGDTLTILYYDPIPEGYTPQKGEQIMTMLNQYVTGAGRKIEWGGELQNFWHETNGKIYFANGGMYTRDGFPDGLSFKEYARSLGKTL